MKKLLGSVLGIGFVCLFAVDAHAQATTAANASATIILPITLTKNADLNFGELSASATAGTATVSPAGVRTVGGGVTGGSTASVSAAGFTVSGDALRPYTITLPASATVVNGANNMTVNSFTSVPSGSGTIGLLGSQTLNIGATLQVNANQAAGLYSGSFNVTVAYQ
jgi:uncharacterized protein DUF4402